MSSNVKTAVFWVVIICAVVLVYMAVKTGRGPTPPICKFLTSSPTFRTARSRKPTSPGATYRAP